MSGVKIHDTRVTNNFARITWTYSSEGKPNPRAIPHLFERLFLISWENNRDCLRTMLLYLKTMEMQIKGDQ